MARAPRVVVAVAAVSYGVLLAVALSAAIQAYGRPFPSLFVDPFGDFSNVHLPAWGIARLDLRAMDHLVAIDHRPLDAGTSPVEALEARLSGSSAGSTVPLTFERGDARTEVTAAIRRLGSDELWLFFGVYVLFGIATLWLGLVVLHAAPRGSGARAYAAFSTSGAVFFATFFDYHTTRWMSPVFAAMTAAVPLTALWVAADFPRPSPRTRPLRLALAVVGVPVAILVTAAAWRGWDIRALRAGVNFLVPVSLAVVALSMAARLARSEGLDRLRIRSAFFGVCMAPAVVSLGYVVTAFSNTPLFHLLLPFAMFLVPAAIGRSFLRHDIVESRAVLRPHILVWPAAVFGGLVGGFTLWCGLKLLAIDQSVVIVLALLAAAVAATASWRYGRLRLFAARSRFQPTIEELANELAELREPAEIASTLRALILRWLPTPDVEVRFASTEGAGEAIEGSGARWSESRSEILVPMRFASEDLGLLAVKPKHGQALYTTEDLRLLETMAALAAVALHNAHALHEVQALRALERAASREETRLKLDAFSAEMAHEMAYSVNYFRYLLRELGRSSSVDAEELDVGQEELERLEGMLAQLRRVQARPLELRRVEVADIVARAVRLLEPTLPGGADRVAVHIEGSVAVRADGEALLQVIVNLLKNALQASGASGAVEVRAFERSGVVIEVRDTGPGISSGIRERIFQPWFSTKADGGGMGLSIVQRVVRSLDWKLDVAREESWTVFRIQAPSWTSREEAE